MLNPVAGTSSRLQICFAIWLHLSTERRACTHGKASSRQDCYHGNCSKFIGKDEWPPNSPDLNPLDYHVWGAMLERYKSFQPSRKTSMSSRKFCIMQLIWDQQPQDPINKAILSFPKRLRACVKAGVEHFEHTLKWTTCQMLVFVVTVTVSVFLDNENYKLLLIIPCRIENMAYNIIQP